MPQLIVRSAPRRLHNWPVRRNCQMDKFTQLTGIAAPLPIINLDTDKIFPAVYLKTIKRTGLSKWLFGEIRFSPNGPENPDFVSNQAPYATPKLLSTPHH